jgi:hypothetical protein
LAAAGITLVPWGVASQSPGEDVTRYRVQSFGDPFVVFERLLSSPQWAADKAKLGTRAMVSRMALGFRGTSSIATADLDHLVVLVQANGWYWLARALMGSHAFQYPSLPPGTPTDWDSPYSERHIQVALGLWKQILMTWRAVLNIVPTPGRMAIDVRSVLVCSGYQRLASGPRLVAASAEAQETFTPVVLEPLVNVYGPVDPVIWSYSGSYSGGMNAYVGGLTSWMAATPTWTNYGNWQNLLNAYNRTLAVPPPPPPLSHPFVFDATAQSQMITKLHAAGIGDLDKAEILMRVGAGMGMIITGGKLIVSGGKYFGMGLSAGTITMAITYSAIGTISIVYIGLPLVVAGVALLYLTYKQNTAPQVSAFDGFMLPLVGSAEAAVIP